MGTTTSTAPENATTKIGAQRLPAVAAFLLGLLILGVAGFAQGHVHGATHDTRHVVVFPCH